MTLPNGITFLYARQIKDLYRGQGRLAWWVHSKLVTISQNRYHVKDPKITATSSSAILQQAFCPQPLGYQLEKERFSRRSWSRTITNWLGEAGLPGLYPRAIPSPGRHLVYWAELDSTNHSIIYWLPRAHRLQGGRANLNWPYQCKLNRTTHPSKQSAPLEKQAWVILLQL